MSERHSLSKLQIVGVIAAIIGVVGYAVFGWRFGESDGILPFALGAVFGGVAIVWTLYQRLSGGTP